MSAANRRRNYDLARLIESIGGDQSTAAESLGLSRERARYYLRTGLSLDHADQLAARAGLPALSVWPEMADDIKPEPGVREEVTSAGVVSGRRACGLVGVSYRQLDYWARTKVLPITVPAHGSGSRRGLSPDDVRRLDVLARARRAGFEVALIDEALRRQWADPPPDEVTLDLPDVEGVHTAVSVRSFHEIAAGATDADRAAYGRERTIVRAAL